jgi:hypothetical protein
MKRLIKFLLVGVAYTIICAGCNIIVNNDNTDEPVNIISQGKIIGYLKCFENETKNTIYGIFIISNNKNSLLSFNVPFSIYGLDTNKVDYGINFLDGDSIRYNYRIANSTENKQFDCPPSTMLNPTFYPVENFTQVIMTDIIKIK